MDHCQSAWVRLDTELLLRLLYDYHCNGYYHSGQRTDISSTLGLWFTQELYGNMQPQVLCQLLVWRSYQTLQVLNKSQRYIFRSKIGKNTHDDPHVYTADAYMDANDTQTHAHTYTHTRTHAHTKTNARWSYSAQLSHTPQCLTQVLFSEVVYSNFLFFPEWPVSVAYCWCCFRLKTKHRKEFVSLVCLWHRQIRQDRAL